MDFLLINFFVSNILYLTNLISDPSLRLFLSFSLSLFLSLSLSLSLSITLSLYLTLTVSLSLSLSLSVSVSLFPRHLSLFIYFFEVHNFNFKLYASFSVIAQADFFSLHDRVRRFCLLSPSSSLTHNSPQLSTLSLHHFNSIHFTSPHFLLLLLFLLL